MMVASSSSSIPSSTGTPELRLQSETVQEILEIDRKKVPKQYICSNQSEGSNTIKSYVPVAELQVIDLVLLSSPSSVEGQKEIENLCTALSSWGCFQVINHGISRSFLDKFRQVIKNFFYLPAEEKKRYSRSIGHVDGYGNDTILSDSQVLDWCDRLYLLVFPQDQRKLNVWPENPSDLRETLHDYCKHLQTILEIILKAMARSLNLQENCFLDQYGERGIIQARINYYPPCPRPDSVLGLKPHSDGSAVTIVLPDKQVEGLQFLKQDQWFKVPIIPDALLVNLGDQAEIMSNGSFKSPVHRVLTNSENERISVAVFCLPDPENEIQPVEELINRESRKRYKSVKDYVRTYFDYYQQNKRPIDAVKI